MRFFEIDDASFQTKGFAWAAGYGPIESMPFLPPAFLAQFRAFWKINPMSPGIHIDPGGRKWPDALGCGGSPPTFFVSKKVVDSLRSIGAPIARLTEMPVSEINAKSLRSIPAPRYFVVEVASGIELDFKASNFPIDATGKPIFDPWPKQWSPVFRSSSWNGTDLFGYSVARPGLTTALCCTERVKELAEREGWTNVRFKPMAMV